MIVEETLRAEEDIKVWHFWETDIEASAASNSFQETGYARNRRSGLASTKRFDFAEEQIASGALSGLEMEISWIIQTL